MKRVLVYAYLAGNLGDDLLVTILCRRYPKVEFHMLAEERYKQRFAALSNAVIHTPGDALVQEKGQWMEKHRRQKANGFLMWMASQCYATVHIGGSVFVQHQDDFSAAYQTDADLCRYSKRLYVVGANFGPYTAPDYYRRYHALFARYRGICFRDQPSYDKFQDLPRVRWAPDVTFAYRPADPLPSSEKTVVISVLDLEHRGGKYSICQHQAGYEANLAALGDLLVEQGYKVVLVSFCEMQGDETAARRIQSAMKQGSSPQVEILAYQDDLQPVLDAFAKADRVVATRFHSIVLGWLYDKPVLPIVYDLKCTQLLEDNQQDYLTLEQWNQAQPKQLLGQLLERPGFDSKELREQAQEQFAFTDRALNSRLGLFG